LLREAKPGVDVSLVGELCHIRARKLAGPRGEAGLTAQQLDDYDNLIPLCQPHHKQVDDHPERYTAAALREIKKKHEEWVKTELSRLEPWRVNVSQFSYLNVPRLSILAAMNNRIINLRLTEEQTLHSLGWELNRVMLEFSRLLNEITLTAIELPSSVNGADERMAGITFSFNTRFRTKNMPCTGMDQVHRLTGDISRDPHIYKKLGEWRIILAIDPRWITTTTAWGEFMPSAGHRVFAGLCTVKSVEEQKKEIYATPLIIGFPKSTWEEFLTTNDRTLEIPNSFD